jgi:xylitol oxidase
MSMAEGFYHGEESMNQSTTNWAGNLTYGAKRLHRPTGIEQLQEMVAGSRKLRALGTRHSFNDIADTPEDLVSMKHFTEIGTVDPVRMTVTVGGGVRYGELGQALESQGFALHNMASLPHISVAGACQTATHGSGDNNGNLATAVTAIEFVAAEGTVHSLSLERDQRDFKGAVVGLGAVGLITRLTLAVEPSFQVAQQVFEDLPFETAIERFDEISSSAYAVSLFTRWTEPSVDQVWLKHKLDHRGLFNKLDRFYGATAATENMHPIRGVSAVNCTEQLGVPGPWYERLPHFRLEHTPSSGDELQSEYIVPRTHGRSALLAISKLAPRIAPLLYVSEIRTVAADDLWMSPCNGQPCVCIHFTLKPMWDEVRELLPVIEDALSPFEARPHWGKLFTMGGRRLRTLYPRMPEFQSLIERFDPERKLINPFLERVLFDIA